MKLLRVDKLKHIFHIHSNINYLSSVLAIANNKIKKENVLFICFRGIKCDGEFGSSIKIDDLIYLHPFNSPRNIFSFKFLNNRKYITYIDECIEGFIGDDYYTYYAPHCKNPIYSIFISHPKCAQVHYIEDGMDAYLEAEDLLQRFPESIHFSHKILKIAFTLLPWANIDRTPNFKMLYKSIGRDPSICYGINPEAFRNRLISNREILPLPNSVKEFFKFEPNFNVVFVFDALVEQNVINLEQLESFWIWFLDNTECEKVGISLKFHPFQNESSKDMILQKVNNKCIPFEIIPEHISMETFFVFNEEYDIYGIGSSLLKYSCLKNKDRTHILYEYFEKELGYICNRKASWDALFK